MVFNGNKPAPVAVRPSSGLWSRRRRRGASPSLPGAENEAAAQMDGDVSPSTISPPPIPHKRRRVWRTAALDDESSEDDVESEGEDAALLYEEEELDYEEEEISDGETLGSEDSERSVDSSEPHTSDEEFIDDEDPCIEDSADMLARSRWSSSDSEKDVSPPRGRSWSLVEEDCVEGEAAKDHAREEEEEAGRPRSPWPERPRMPPSSVRRRCRSITTRRLYYSDEDSDEDCRAGAAEERRGRSRYRAAPPPPRSRRNRPRDGDLRSRSRCGRDAAARPSRLRR